MGYRRRYGRGYIGEGNEGRGYRRRKGMEGGYRRRKRGEDIGEGRGGAVMIKKLRNLLPLNIISCLMKS